MARVNLRYGLAGWYRVAGWINDQYTWHYSDDVSYAPALCGKPASNSTDPTRAIMDDVGEPQPNDCEECRRRVDERKVSDAAA